MAASFSSVEKSPVLFTHQPLLTSLIKYYLCWNNTALNAFTLYHYSFQPKQASFAYKLLLYFIQQFVWILKLNKNALTFLRVHHTESKSDEDRVSESFNQFVQKHWFIYEQIKWLSCEWVSELFVQPIYIKKKKISSAMKLPFLLFRTDATVLSFYFPSAFCKNKLENKTFI